MTASTSKGIQIPASNAFVKLCAISNTNMVGLPWNLFFGPPRKGMDAYNCPDYCFLITHPNGRRILFDMGVAQDWKTYAPPPQLPLLEGWEANGASITVSKQVREILDDENVVLRSHQDAILWSHAHFDHVGKISTFPKIPLIVGEGLATTFSPGYPENQQAPFWSDEWNDREIIVASFDTEFEIGGFKAWDYFEDGSVYILDAPGHSPGHLNALVRVAQDSLVFLGGDSYHHGSQIRPSLDYPLPESIDVQLPHLPFPCPCHALEPLYAVGSEHRDDRYTPFVSNWSQAEKNTPLLTIGYMESGETVATDLTAALTTIQKIQAFDADDRVFCFPAHEASLVDAVPLFPRDINNWKNEGWKEKTRWTFLKDYAPVLENGQA